ncbi:hypothetical protein HanRHA438_Chr02g0063361 [Helianthus annuus]|nr:hypothetical protein HanRHA438_Chr02g0063361 [Helianthus annuus]
MSGSNIFADGKAESRDYLGARKPPGGDSSIALLVLGGAIHMDLTVRLWLFIICFS